MMDPIHEAPELISVGTQSMVDRAQSLGLTWQMRQATVIDSSVPSVVRAQYDGDTTILSMVSTVGPLLQGQRVYVLEVPPAGNFIVGAMTTGPVVPNVECTSVIGLTASGTTALASFATMPGTPTVTFRKAGSLSRLRIDLTGTFFSTGASAGIEAGVNLGTPGDFAIATVNAANSSLNAHTPFAGHRMLDPAAITGGIPAGDYLITGVWRRNSGAGTLNADGNDMWSCCVEEIP